MVYNWFGSNFPSLCIIEFVGFPAIVENLELEMTTIQSSPSQSSSSSTDNESYPPPSGVNRIAYNITTEEEEITDSDKDKDKQIPMDTNNKVEVNSEVIGSVEVPSQNATMTTLSSFHEERMRRKLQFFFMNPIEKWKARQRFPYKFVVQVIKLIIVTMQLSLFAHSRYNHVNYTSDNRLSFSHLFLRNWDASMEVIAYPPATGPFALYIKEDFFETVNYAYDGYASLSKSIGPYSYPNEDNSMPPMQLCISQYREGKIFGFNESYVFNPIIDTTCTSLLGNITELGSKRYLAANDQIINFDSLVRAELRFSVKTVNFKAAGIITPPDCYRFDITISFDNSDHDGQMLLALDADNERLHCTGDVRYIKTTEIDAILRSILNIIVIIICVISFVLCTRALYRAALLRQNTVEFFRVHYKRQLTLEEKFEFVNIWYIMIIINDVLLILGSAMKEQIEQKNFTANEWNTCSVLLGTGNLLVWFGVLRYLGFFKTYNVVILTLKAATPKVMRFLLAALLIYAGFTFCGWLVFGPYHAKFRTLSTSSECLFALINGDDMFATFTTMPDNSIMLWWFCRIYLYSFISLYIYVVLSLFISVIMDAYDTIKKYYKEGFPMSELKKWIGTMEPHDFDSGVFIRVYEDDSESWADVFKRVICCCRSNSVNTPGPTGYTSLGDRIAA